MGAAAFDSLRLALKPKSRAIAWAQSTRPGIQFVRLPLATIRMRVEGGGPKTIVFATDPPNVIEHYDRLFERLTPFFRVVCFDLPGFGFSFPSPRFRYTADDLVDTIAELLRRVDEGPSILAFSCGSAYPAIRLANERSDLVERLVVIQAPSLPEQVKWAERVDPRKLIRTPLLGQLILATGSRRIARGWYEVALPRERPSRSFADPALEALKHGACFCLASGLQELCRSRRAPQPVAKPSMVVWGMADRTHRRTAKGSIREYLADPEWHEFPDAGHFPELEQPDRFAELVTRFGRHGA